MSRRTGGSQDLPQNAGQLNHHYDTEGSVEGDNAEDLGERLPAMNQRVLPPANRQPIYPQPVNQQPMNGGGGNRAARRDDEFEELAREFMARENQRMQAERRDMGRTMRGMSAPFIHEAPWCIRFPAEADYIEITSGLIHHLPKFAGMPTESPMKHLKEFHGVCMSMKPATVSEETYKLKAFQFSLLDSAKSWLMSLPSGSIHTWDQLQRKFLEKYFSHARVTQIRRELSGIKQENGETLFEYLERFRKLEESCPNHGIPPKMLLDYFMDGMVPLERRMLDASARGTILDMYPEEVWELIEKVAESTRYLMDSRRHAPVSNVNVHSELQELKAMMAHLMGQQPQVSQH